MERKLHQKTVSSGLTTGLVSRDVAAAVLCSGEIKAFACFAFDRVFSDCLAG